VMSATAPLTDKDGKPATVWSAVKFAEVKDKKEKTLMPAPPELLAALGNKIAVNGTHVVQCAEKDVTVVVFCGHASQVETVVKPNADKSGVYYKVIIPMI